MRIKTLIWEDTVNYRKPSLFIGTATCDFKCGKDVCQNAGLIDYPDIIMDDISVIKRYKKNKITQAIVFGGLEPLDQLDELLEFCRALNLYAIYDDLVIYTGYTRQEEDEKVQELLWVNRGRPLIIKYGRYIPNATERYDKVLGVKLASENQSAIKEE